MKSQKEMKLQKTEKIREDTRKKKLKERQYGNVEIDEKEIICKENHRRR